MSNGHGDSGGTRPRATRREGVPHSTLMQVALDALPVSVFVLGADDVYIDWRSGGSATTFVPPEVFLGRHVSDVLPANVAAQVAASLAEVRSTGNQVAIEYALPEATGTRRYQARLVPLPEDCIAALVLDVSERVVSAERLRDQEAETRRLLAFSPAVVYSLGLNGDVPTVRSVSANVSRILGYTVEEVLTPGWLAQSFHPEDFADIQRELRQLPLEGQAIRECRLRDAAGTQRWIRQEQAYVTHDRGVTGEVVGAWVDITTEHEQRLALRDRDARLQTIVDTEPECVKVLAPDGALIEMNPAGLRMLEARSLAEVQQQTLLDYVVPEHRAAFAALSRKVFAGGTGILEFEVQGLRGTKRWLETNAVPLRDATGAVTSLLGITRDVTEHHAVLEALRRSEARYRQIIETTSEGVWVIDAQSRTSFANPRMAEMLGYTVEEMIGRPLFDFMDEEGQRIARANVERRKAGVTEAHDFLFRRKDGTALWTRVQTNPLVDKANQYAGALAMISDATESRAAEHALRSSEERFRALIEHSSDVTMLFDAEGTTTFVSPSYTTAMGFQPEEIVGTRARDLVHPDDRAVVMAARLRLLQTPGAVDRVVMRTRHRDGHWRTFEAINRNLLHLPSVAAIVSNLRDITEQRRIEEQYLQAQKLAAIGRLAGGIAHDFNNILTAILGYSELLESEPDRATRVDDLRRIQRAGERARDLTMQLLAFARRQVISPRAVDLSEVVDHSLHLVRRLLGEDVEIDTLLLPDLGSVQVDPAQIEQVLLNLAINARDAMPSGGRLTIQTAGVVFDAEFAASNPDVVAGPHVMLVVSDTGSGIDAVDLPHIFEPFYTTKPVGEGTGLGLATSYGIVKQSGGHVFVSSEPGVGTTFKLCFPRLDVPVAAVASEAPVTPPSGGTESILLVEDDADVSELISQTLRESGYRVLVAASPAEALRLLDGAGVTFDLLLTDVVMPGMSGRQLAEQVTARFSRMCVLYVSGYAEDTVMRHGVVDTGVEFLAKPFTPTTLRQAVRRLLDQGRATRPGGPTGRPV